MHLKNFLIFILAAFSSSSFAYFCPNNFSTIDIGDPIEQVKQLCGQPTSANTFKKSEGSMQEWQYYIKTSYADATQNKVKVLLKDNKIVNINIANSAGLNQACLASLPQDTNPGLAQIICKQSVQDQNFSSSAVCGAAINVGDTAEKLEMACGKPATVNQLGQSDPSQPSIEVSELNYDGTPPVTLVFNDGRLVDARS